MVTDQTKSDNRASEQRYRHIFENLPTCNFIINRSVIPLHPGHPVRLAPGVNYVGGGTYVSVVSSSCSPVH